MISSLVINEAAIQQLLTSGEARKFFQAVGREVRDRARANASHITSKTDAIISLDGQDSDGVYVDVGYSKHHPGFFLWWWEVGTVRHGPRPHLRPALSPR